jgi:hypothetical protein
MCRYEVSVSLSSFIVFPRIRTHASIPDSVIGTEGAVYATLRHLRSCLFTDRRVHGRLDLNSTSLWHTTVVFARTANPPIARTAPLTHIGRLIAPVSRWVASLCLQLPLSSLPVVCSTRRITAELSICSTNHARPAALQSSPVVSGVKGQRCSTLSDSVTVSWHPSVAPSMYYHCFLSYSVTVVFR